MLDSFPPLQIHVTIQVLQNVFRKKTIHYFVNVKGATYTNIVFMINHGFNHNQETVTVLLWQPLCVFIVLPFPPSFLLHLLLLCCCVSIQGLHPSEAAFEGQLRHYTAQPTNAAFFYLFLEDAVLQSFLASHIPRFFACRKRRKKREKKATSPGTDCTFRWPGWQKS